MIDYEIKYTNQAVQDLDEIFKYISSDLSEPGIASNLLNELEKSVLSLQNMPYRCAVRQVGVYAGMGYRQLLVKNFNVIYRIDEAGKNVIVITVRYSKSSF